MIRAAQPYLNFAGNGGEAIAHYQKALGAEVVALMKWSDMPGQEIPKELADYVMHAELKIGEGVIMISDVPPHMSVDPGNQTSVMLQCTEPAEVDRMFDAVSAGGEVIMAPENTFWGARYGQCVDRYGVRWMFNCPLENPGA